MRKTNVHWTDRPILTQLFSPGYHRIIYQAPALTIVMVSAFLEALSCVQPQVPYTVAVPPISVVGLPGQNAEEYTETSDQYTDRYCLSHCLLQCADQFELV
jgi:hypothetical protein